MTVLVTDNIGSSANSRSHYHNRNATILAAEKLLDAMRKDDGIYRTYDEMNKDNIPLGKYLKRFTCLSREFKVDVLTCPKCVQIFL